MRAANRKRMSKPSKKELIEKIKQQNYFTQEEKTELIGLLNKRKRYGLVWEDKLEEAEELLKENLPLLQEVKERAIINDDSAATPNHILIEGDNLHALTSLCFTHEGKVDVIYIDPPYNTGNEDDFKYNDDYVDKEDAFRHSKWLSFMNKRLRLMKLLLKTDGVIFISIGDDEVAQLTLLMNGIFFENNQLGIVARLSKPADDQGNYFSSSKDYILAYTKDVSRLQNFKGEVDITLFKKVEVEGERKGEKYRDDVAFYQASLGVRPNLRYFIECPDGSFVIPPGNIFPTEIKDGSKIKPASDDDKCWRWSAETYFTDKKLLVFKKTKKSPLVDENGNRAKYNVYTKSYFNDRAEKGSSPRDYVDGFINRKGADLIKQYDIDFKYSKPVELVKHLIGITNKSKDIKVVDAFAGSGTTLHSVLQLNSKDNGTRQCIIITNNEVSRKELKQLQEIEAPQNVIDEHGICQAVTYPRCKRIIEKYTNKNGTEMPFFPNNNLRYYKSEFVSREQTLQNKRELTKLATDLLCIKENCYTEIKSKELGAKSAELRVFSQNGKTLMVVYDDMYIPKAVEVIKGLEGDIKVYVFAEGQEPYREDFEDVLDRVVLCALPDAIYKAYQHVLPKQKKEIEKLRV